MLPGVGGERADATQARGAGEGHPPGRPSEVLARVGCPLHSAPWHNEGKRGGGGGRLDGLTLLQFLAQMNMDTCDGAQTIVIPC